jgi:hypothetical protein
MQEGIRRFYDRITSSWKAKTKENEGRCITCEHYIQDEVALEYIDTIKKTNNDLQSEINNLKLEIKALDDKEKLDYYIWKNASQEFPDKYNLCLCKCFDQKTMEYQLLIYKVFQGRWCDINGVAYEGKVIKYIELPKL